MHAVVLFSQTDHGIGHIVSGGMSTRIRVVLYLISSDHMPATCPCVHPARKPNDEIYIICINIMYVSLGVLLFSLICGTDGSTCGCRPPPKFSAAKIQYFVSKTSNYTSTA